MKTLLIAVALTLAACGSDPETQPAPPRPEVVAVHEVCTVTIQPDGSLVCTCVPAKEAP